MYGMITADGNIFINKGNNIIKVKYEFRKYLIPFRQFPVKQGGYKLTKNSVEVKFDKKIHPLMLDTITKPAPDDDIEMIINEDSIIIRYKEKNEELKTDENKKEKVAKESKKEEIDTSSENEESVDVVELNITKKLTDIDYKKGRYKITYPSSFKWVLIVLHNGSRKAIKQSGDIVEVEDNIRSITPVKISKHQNS